MILVTGATGLVGTHLLIRLVKEKQPIRAMYRTAVKKDKAKEVFLQCCDPQYKEAFDNIDWVEGDLNDITELTSAFMGVTHVYHCAAMISFNPSHYRKLRRINIEGTANIVNLCLIYKVQKLCYVSSIAAIGESLGNIPIDETNEWNTEVLNSVYAITKYGAEMEVWRGTQEGLDAVIVNPGVIIGPGFFDTGSGYLFKKIHKGIGYYTTGVTGYVAVQDVTQIMYSLMNSSIINERYIVVGENISFKSVFEMIAKGLGTSAPKKKASPFLMTIACYIQWFLHTFFGSKRLIFKSSIKSAFSTTVYENDKIKKELSYKFYPIQKAITETSSFYLKVKL